MPVLGSGQNQRTTGSVIRYGSVPSYPCPAQLRPLVAPQLAEVAAYQVVNTANTTVEYQGFGVYRITKTGGVNGGADANVTSAALTGDFVLRVRLLDTASWIDFGASAVPSANPYYDNIDRSLHTNPGDALYGYEDGVYAGAFVPLATATFYFMRRAGSTITVLSGTSPNVADATLFDTLTDLGGTVYLDIGLVTVGGSADVLLLPAATVYTLTADPAAFTITGQSANLAATRRLTTSAGSYTLSGQSAALKALRRLTANPATYSFNGQSANLRANRLLTAQVASYALTGQSAALSKAYPLVLNAAPFTISGQSAGLNAIRRLALNTGAYALSGQSASLLKQYRLMLQAGAFTLAGQSAILAYSGTGGGAPPRPRVHAFFYR